jgi:hypothetical protein
MHAEMDFIKANEWTKKNATTGRKWRPL